MRLGILPPDAPAVDQRPDHRRRRLEAADHDATARSVAVVTIDEPPPPAPRVHGAVGAADDLTAWRTRDFAYRSASRLDSAGLSLSPSSGAIRARSPAQREWFHTAEGPGPCIVHSLASAAPGGTRLLSRPVTRQDSSIARGTASAMRRDAFASEHSPVFRRHWSVDRPMTTSSGTLRPPRPLSPVLPVQRQPFWQPYVSEFATTSYAED